MAWKTEGELWGSYSWGTDLSYTPLNIFNLTIPERTIEIGSSGTSGSFNLSVPVRTLDLRGASSFNIAIPKRVISITNSSVSTGVFNLVIPKKTLTFTQAPVGGKFSLTQPIRVLSLVENVVSKGIFSLNIPNRHINFVSEFKSIGAFNFILPKRTLSFSGASATSGVFNILIPNRVLNFSSHNAVENIVVLVMNTDTGAGPFTWSDFVWDSMIQFDGRIFLADSTGLYEYTGTLDKEVDMIDSYFTIPESDFGVSDMKTIEDAVVNMVGGPAYIQTFHDSSFSSDHLMNTTNGELVNKRAKLGLGLRQTHWGIKIRNINGSSFKVNSIELDGVIHSRKINQK